MGSIPEVYQDRGPVPGTVIVSRVAEEDMLENTLVTWGTTNRSCKKAGATDVLMGWSQGVAKADKEIDIHLFAPMWKLIVAADSDAIFDGDALEQSADGEVRRGVEGSNNQTVFMAMNDAVAGTFVLAIYGCCSVATPVES
jgi:hypothetical protein